MYVWLWRHLPGNRLLRALQCLVLFLVAVAVLFFVVFPKVAPLLPWTHVTVHGTGTGQ